LDDGSPIRVTVTIDAGGRATIDFAGTAGTHRGNLNATPAIVNSAVLYVLRLLVREPLPLNEGLLGAVTLRIPPGSLLNPRFDPDDPARCPAVVGGNTETSQRLVDTLIKALGLAAGSQGTMNNVLWGTDAFGYYETVCGGAGATSTAPGAHAVHTHMTNTRITDPEIIERRYRCGSSTSGSAAARAGPGDIPGGDGVVRAFTFLAPMALSVLTQHRTHGPYGLAGGLPGWPGAQSIVRAGGGAIVPLSSIDGCDVGPGDRLLLETPGGGGWAASQPPSPLPPAGSLPLPSLGASASGARAGGAVPAGSRLTNRRGAAAAAGRLCPGTSRGPRAIRRSPSKG
jgi:5-oxoprolinase (ATP-hydrolysing)